MEILGRNFHDGRAAEIDLIGREGETILFVEVKFRRSLSAGTPEEAVTASKQRTICAAARYYLYCRHLPETTPVRFDVVAIRPAHLLPSEARDPSVTASRRIHIRWIRDAFPFLL